MKNWDDWQIKQFEHEIQWLINRINSGVSNKQRREYEHQIRKKELEIAFNDSH
jgi:hypothetical protein